MANCKYIIGDTTYNSYRELLDHFTDEDIQGIFDILFSQDATTKQTQINDKIEAIRKSNQGRTFDYRNMQMIDGSADLQHDTKTTFTPQTLIDSDYFTFAGERPIWQLSQSDYVNAVKMARVKAGEITQEAADQWGESVQQNWDTIAKNATDLHSLIMRDSRNSFSDWSAHTVDTAFSNITQTVMNAEDAISAAVMQKNRNGYLKKNINITTDLKGLDEKIIGHIDYLVVRDNGEVDVYNVKTSTESVNFWTFAKKEKYKYEMALLKQMLANQGINADTIRLNIIPVQITYEADNYNVATDITVQNPIAIDMDNSRYSFEQYDKVAQSFIQSTADFTQVQDAGTFAKVTEQLQFIFPGKGIVSKGISQTAEEWAKNNWRYCKPEAQPNGGYKLTIPDTNETIELSDPRKAEHNKEFVQWVGEHIVKDTDIFQGAKSARRIAGDIRNSYDHKYTFYAPTSTGSNSNYIAQQLSKYFSERDTKPDGSFDYRWELIDCPALEDANILAFRNVKTGQLDVITVTGLDPTVKNRFFGRSHLLGAYLQSTNDENFTLEANYGNMDAIRTMALLNEVLPKVNGTFVLGQLKVLGTSTFNKKGVVFEFGTLVKDWRTIVRIVNANTEAGIVNNFDDKKMKCVEPLTVLRQLWQDIQSSSVNIDRAEIKGINDILYQNLVSEASEADCHTTLDTVEGKIIKLEQLLARLKTLMTGRGIDIHNTQRLAQLAESDDRGDGSTNLIKLFVVASKVLSMYYGDTIVENESYSAMEEYMMKPGSIANSQVRRVVYLTQKTLDIIRGSILDTFSDGAMEAFQEFYQKAGYTKAQNNLIGNQSVTYKNLFEYDENGKNLFIFKNPYDPMSNLKPYERNFLKKILFEFYKIKCRMNNTPCDITGIDDQKLYDNMPQKYLWVPLQKASAATRNTNIKANVSRVVGRLGRMLKNPKGAAEEAYGYLDQQDINARDAGLAGLEIYNTYKRSMTNLTERSAYIIDKGEEYFETNVENIFIDFLSKQTQCEEFEKLLIRIKGIELALTLKGIDEGDEKAINDTVKSIDDFVSVNIYNKTIMGKGAQIIDSWIAPFRKLVSKMYIMANLMGFVRDTVQGLEANFLRAAAKFQTDVNMSDVKFGYDIILRKGCMDTKTMAMLNQFNIKYAFSNFDAAKVAERLKSGRRGILNANNWLYWTLRAPDYLNRMVLFVAKLHHDGIYDAYSLNDKGRLVYDWRKDKRFEVYASGDTNNPKYKEQRAAYMSLIRAFNQESSSYNLSYTDDLPDAYTPSKIRSIKTLGESIYGAYDQSSKNKAENIAIGRNFMFFFTWMNGMVDNYFKRRQISESELKTVQETDYDGNLLYFVPDGNGATTTENTGEPVMKDVPIMVQGVFGTVYEVLKEAYYGGWDSFKSSAWGNPMNRRNLKRAFHDLIIAGLLALLFKMWLTPKYKEHKANDDGQQFFTNAIYELMYKGAHNSYDVFFGPAAIINYFGENTNPASYTLQKKLVTDTYNFLSGKKNFGQTLMNSQAFFRSMQDSYKMWARDSANKK